MYNIDSLHLFLLESLIINISGLFYFKEVLLVNIFVGISSTALMLISKTDALFYKMITLLQIIVLNLFDIHSSFSRELNGLKNLRIIEKKSLQLSQFVNRLLPKHVPKNPKTPLRFKKPSTSRARASEITTKMSHCYTPTSSASPISRTNTVLERWSKCCQVCSQISTKSATDCLYSKSTPLGTATWS
jgi:hypothetical protein